MYIICELVTWSGVAGSQWEKENEACHIIHNVHKKGSKLTAHKELCNSENFLFPISGGISIKSFFFRKGFKSIVYYRRLWEAPHSIQCWIPLWNMIVILIAFKIVRGWWRATDIWCYVCCWKTECTKSAAALEITL